jgi:cytochrome c biogenesis protein ResB
VSASPPAGRARSPKSLGSEVVRVLGSFGLAVALLVLLLVLTFLGTLEQAHKSLYDVQAEYFESIVHIYRIELTDSLSIPLPLPGAYLILALLAVNLVVGGILRMRRSLSNAGVFIIHGGILLLLLGSFVEYHWSQKGHMSIREGQTAGEFESYFDWEVAITEHLANGGVREYVIPHETFAELDDGETARATSDRLPFEVVLSNFIRNARPYTVASSDGGEPRVGLDRVPPDSEKAERNMAGLTVQLVPRSGPRHEVLLWAAQSYPARVEIEGRPWEIDLRHKRWPLPFEITLDDFQMERHPGTSMASRFSSYVTKAERGESTKIHISMNEPLRTEGYTLYQSGWGPPDAPPGTKLFSTLSVVRNPSDYVPWYSWTIILIGLVWHFGTKLSRHIRAELRRHA